MANLPDVVADYIAAYNAMDVDGMLACLSETVSFRNISGNDVTAEAGDKQSFAEMARFGVTAFSERQQRVTNAITVDDTTLVEIDYSAVIAKDLPNGWEAGQSLSFSGASLFRISGGKITHIVDQS